MLTVSDPGAPEADIISAGIDSRQSRRNKVLHYDEVIFIKLFGSRAENIRQCALSERLNANLIRPVLDSCVLPARLS